MWLAEELESRVLLSATLLKDTNVDQPSGTLRTLGSINDGAIFAEENGSGLQIFSSDGTSAGTKLLAAMDTATDDAPRAIATVGNTLYFRATVGFTTSLWKTDGTQVGTFKLNNVLPSDVHAVLGNELFFFATEQPAAAGGRVALWKTDGTIAGTVRVSNDIGSAGTAQNQALAAFNGA